MFSQVSVPTLYAAWFFVRSFLHRGWWLVASLYLVTEANLSASELIFVGTAQAFTVIAAEVPAGIFADSYSRKWSLVIAHALMGLGMLCTGLVLSFPALMITQMVWGLSWTFSSGADVAWMTDELDDPEQTTEALIRAAKWGHAGSALGILSLGALAWSTSLATAIIAAGISMWILGFTVGACFPEANFTRAQPGKMLSVAVQTLKQGVHRLRYHRVLVHILLCTYLVNGADEAFGRLYAKQLVDLGLPNAGAPILWLSLLGFLSLICSIAALSAVNSFLKYKENYAQVYGVAAFTGAAGLLLFAFSSTAEIAAISILLVGGVATSVMRTVSVVWANKHSSSDVRATVQSFLSLAENLGEATVGFCLALVAGYAGISPTMVVSSSILLGVVLLVEHRRREK